MSAYVVTKATITAMLQAVKYDRQGIYVYWKDKSYPIKDSNLTEVGQKLLDENFRSVEYLYDGRMKWEEQDRTYVHLPIRQLTAVEILKACNGYRYQACECADWLKTEAFEIFDSLREETIRALPGYEEADTWEVYEEVCYEA